MNPTPGGYGSLWTTVLLARNGSALPAVFESPSGCVIGTCPRGVEVPAESAADTRYVIPPPGDAPGLLVYVQGPQSEAFVFNLRAQDLSRQALTWGTELPVVRESAARTGTTELLGVPLDARFRCLLRVYDFDARPVSLVRVSLLPADSNEPYAELELPLTAFPDASSERPFYPGYAAFGAFQELPALIGVENVRISIRPVTEGLRYWAFVSVTNNETQHVTTITPQ